MSEEARRSASTNMTRLPSLARLAARLSETKLLPSLLSALVIVKMRLSC